jgi:hypothetical protein
MLTITFINLLCVIDVYVVDYIIVGRDGPFIHNFRFALFSTRFDIEDLDPASWLLGCCTIRGRVTITLAISRSQYAVDILE